MYSHRTTLWFLGIALLVIVLGFALMITRPFLSPVASAIILAVVFYPAHERVLRWTKGKPGRASLISTLALLFLFCVPVLDCAHFGGQRGCWSCSIPYEDRPPRKVVLLSF